MEIIATVQGRDLTRSDIEFVRKLIVQHPDWSRRRLSVELSTAWQWRNGNGVLKDMACRSLLLKLHERDHIVLPARRQTPTNRMASRKILQVVHETAPITEPLCALQPLRIIDVRCNAEYEPLYNCLLSNYHYLGYRSPVGENMKYLALDRDGRVLACLLFGSSAWSCASRDEFVGWDSDARRRNLCLTTNNTRFLIAPWVSVPNLASHLLALVCRRLSQDWLMRYGHSLSLVETFVEQTRFAGTCYQAANWRCVGQTQGRSRNDRYTRLQVPVKSVFLFPLSPRFRSELHR
jgi:hypothetical protein